METSKLLARENPVPELPSVMKQEEPLVRDLMTCPVKDESDMELLSVQAVKLEDSFDTDRPLKLEFETEDNPILGVKEEWGDVQEESNMSSLNNEIKNEFPTDEYILGLGDGQDDTFSMASTEVNVDQVDSNVDKLPELPKLLKAQSECHNPQTSEASAQYDHCNGNTSVTRHFREHVPGNHKIVSNCTKHNSQFSHFREDIECFSESELRNQVKLQTDKYKHKCKECGKGFAQRSSLNRHLTIHTGEKKYTCDECGKCFAQSGHLTSHLKIHADERNYKCSECGKCFTLKNNLKTHMRVHTGEKNYKCDDCGKCFTIKSSLNVHSRIHRGEKNYSCNTCGKRFRQSSSRNVHVQIHSSEKNFKCEFCGKYFRTNSQLTRHLMTHTSEKN